MPLAIRLHAGNEGAFCLILVCSSFLLIGYDCFESGRMAIGPISWTPKEKSPPCGRGS